MSNFVYVLTIRSEEIETIQLFSSQTSAKKEKTIIENQGYCCWVSRMIVRK